MNLRNRVRLVIISVIVFWFLAHAWFVGARNFLAGREFWTLLLAVTVGIVISNIIVRRSLSRFTEALAREDIRTAQQEHKLLVDFWRLRGRETMKAYGISILILEERYRDALDQLQALNIERIGKKGAPVVTNQVAWCMAHLGEPDKAIELSQSVFSQMQSLGPIYSSSANLVLGVCEFLSGRPSEAIPHLEKAYSSTKAGLSRKATAAFYLGESHSALGNMSEARSAYQQAHKALPNGRFGVRALDRLRLSFSDAEPQ
jgi:tetratricopeptide (TPR) repeat protein